MSLFLIVAPLHSLSADLVVLGENVYHREPLSQLKYMRQHLPYFEHWGHILISIWPFEIILNLLVALYIVHHQIFMHVALMVFSFLNGWVMKTISQETVELLN